jgi:sterol desaturase/sphingolipid hydroxylase (fatty acid hydroxylase superfamily)
MTITFAASFWFAQAHLGAHRIIEELRRPILLAALHATIEGALVTLGTSCLAAEFFGYWLHRLLHSDKIPFLSHGHLIHHFLIYGPGQPMRHSHYHDATDNRFSVGNIGLEWLLPSALILAVSCLAMFALRIALLYQCVAVATLIAWPVFTFSYLHDRMHLSDFWMARTPLVKVWFLKARRLHDIHHHIINDQGRMEANFGIAFYIFDRLFHTLSHRHRPFNPAGYEAAKKRYALVEAEGHLAPSSDSKIYFSLHT